MNSKCRKAQENQQQATSENYFLHFTKILISDSPS